MGAHIDMVSCIRNPVNQCGVSLTGALDMASGIAARAMGLTPELGRIAVGNAVSLVCLSDVLS